MTYPNGFEQTSTRNKRQSVENLKIGDIKLTDFIAVLKTNVT
jgi:hypothetical protein